MDDNADRAAANLRYLNERVWIPQSMRRQFVNLGSSEIRRSQMAEELSKELGLRDDDHPVLVVQLMQSLMEALAAIVVEPVPTTEYRGTELADAVLSRFTVDECLTIAAYYGWSEQSLEKETRLKDLDRTVHQLLGEHLGAHLTRALEQWAKLQWLGPSASRRELG